MIEVTIRITAPNEETLRRAMDEIADVALKNDKAADEYVREASKPSVPERVAAKYEQLCKRRREIAKVLDAVADAIDHAEPRKVI